MSFPPSVDRLNISRSRARRLPDLSSHLSTHELGHDSYELKNEPSSQYPASGSGQGSAEGVSRGPLLDIGRPGAARLQSQRGRGRDLWTWVWVDKQKTKREYSLDKPSEMLFPPSRTPPAPPPQASLRALIASAHRYIPELEDLRNDWDVDVVVDLATEEISRSYHEIINTSRDAFLGRRLAVIRNPQARLARTLVCFPAGEDANELCVSPFLPKSNARSKGHGLERHVPNPKPVARFDTPILQIQSSDFVSMHRLDYNATALLVRLQSSTHIYRVIPNHTYTPPTSASPAEVAFIGKLSTDDTEGRRHIDIALDPKSWARAIIVDEGGGVWLWWEEKLRLEWDGALIPTMQLRKVRGAVSSSPNPFHRVAFGTRPGTVIVMSLTEAVILDIEDDSREPFTILQLGSTEQFFTSIDKSAYARGATLTCLTTNKQVFWIDETIPTSPTVLRYEHGIPYSHQDHIEIYVLETESDEVVFLSSLKRTAMIAFHVDTAAPGRLRRQPYLIPFSDPADPDDPEDITEHFDFVAIAKSSTSKRRPLVLIGMRPDGALVSTTMKTRQTFPIGYRHLTLKNVKASQSSAGKVGSGNEGSEKAKTRRKVYNARWAWLEINKAMNHEVQLDASVFQHHLREMDAPLESFLTAADLARDAILGPPKDPRSSALRLLPAFNAAEGALEDMRAFITGLASFGYTTNVETDVTRGNVAALAMFTTENRQTRGFTKKDTSVQRDNLSRLEADIRLATTVVHTDGLSDWMNPKVDAVESGEDVDESVAQAASQLTLGAGATKSSEVLFHVLRPNKGVAVSSRRFEDEVESGVRRLLDEWKVGEDPRTYRWRPPPGDPSETEDPAATEPRTAASSTTVTAVPASAPTPRVIRSLPGSKAAGSPNRRGSPSSRPTSRQASPVPHVRTTSGSHIVASSPIPTVMPAERGWEPYPFVYPSVGAVGGSQGAQGGGGASGAGGGGGFDTFGPPSPVPFPQTQTERGPYGGRPEGEVRVKKKAGKKRLGGF